MCRRLFDLIPMLLLLILTVASIHPIQIARADTRSDKIVQQRILYIADKSTMSESWANITWAFPLTIAKAGNLSIDTIYCDTPEGKEALVANKTYQEGNFGKYCTIFIQSQVLSKLNPAHFALIDGYEKRFGVAEGVIGPLLGGVSQELCQRYGIDRQFWWSTDHTETTRLKWVQAGRFMFVNSTFFNITLSGSGVTRYAEDWSEGRKIHNPILWSYRGTGNITRVASVFTGYSPGIGSYIPFAATFWLTLKLSPNNKIMNYLFALDVDDINNSPPIGVSRHMNSDDLREFTSLMNTYGLNPTLAIDPIIDSNFPLPSHYPEFYSALLDVKQKFDYVPHLDLQVGSREGLDALRKGYDLLSSWGLYPITRYMIPQSHLYNPGTAMSMQKAGIEFVAQMYLPSKDSVPYVPYVSYDKSVATLLRIPRDEIRGLLANISRIGDMISTSENWIRDHIEPMTDEKWLTYQLGHCTTYMPMSVGCWWLVYAHGSNLVGERPLIYAIRSLLDTAIFPIVPVRTHALLLHLRFLREYEFSAAYNVFDDSLSYTISRKRESASNPCLIFPTGSASMSGALVVHQDARTTYIEFPYRETILVRLNQGMTTPYVSYSTGRLTSVLWNSLNFTLIMSLNDSYSVEILVRSPYLGRPAEVTNAKLAAFNDETGVSIAIVSSEGRRVSLSWRPKAESERSIKTVSTHASGEQANWYPLSVVVGFGLVGGFLLVAASLLKRAERSKCA